MRSIAIIIIGLFGASCEVIGNADMERIGSTECGETWLCTDLHEYSAVYQGGEGAYSQYGFTIAARYENRFLVPVYLQRCGSYFVRRIEGEVPGYSGYNPTRGCPGYSGLPIFPGEVIEFELKISGPNSWQSGRADGQLAGEFQLVFEIHRCPESTGCELEEEYRASNVFKVNVER